MKLPETYQDLEKKNESDVDQMFMYGWMFTYNPFTKQWCAFEKDHFYEYWSNHTSPYVLRSKHLNTLLDLIHKTKGDVDLIDDLVKGEVK